MTGLLRLFLLLAPWVALIGGATLLVLGVLHVAGVRSLPRIPARQARPAVAASLLGAALAGLGLTYLVTGGAVGYNNVYLLWLGIAAISGVLGLAETSR